VCKRERDSVALIEHLFRSEAFGQV
jgi:hypothetical protein